MSKFLEETKEFLNYKYLDLRFKLIKFLVKKDPVVMNIYITSDIIKFNKLDRNRRVIFSDNTIKHVSDRQSFVYDGKTTHINYR